MYLEAPKHDVTRVNTGVESKFSFVMNATAVQVMNSALYQDKPGSIVRELSCNAYDSHVMAGIADRPFVIHLPSEFESYLSIRDYGIGLDDEGVRNVFASYFNSTKSKSNDCIGAFGLGSKTPFAYSDQFTITAIKDGVKRIYSAFIGEDAIPTVAMMGEPMTTDEGNGVEVMVPVTDAEDFAKFHTAVAEQLRFFAVKPTLVNGSVEFDSFDLIRITDKLSLIRDDYKTGVWIVQGGVGYPVNVPTLRQSVEEANRPFLDYLSSNGAVLTFTIGEIETTASREAVSYTKRTIANIDAMLSGVRDVVADNLYNEIVNMPTQWARATYLNNNQTQVRIIENKKDSFKSLVPDLDPVNHSQLNFSWGLHLDASVGVIQKFETRRMRRGGKYRVEQTSSGVSIKADHSHYNIVIRDTGDKPLIRLNNHVSESCKPAYYIVPADGVGVSEVVAILEKVGLTYTLLSTLPVPPRAARVASNKTYMKPSCYIRGKGENRSCVKDWDRVIPKLAEIENGGYYMVIPEGSRFDVKAMPEQFNFIFKMADADALDKDVYAIRERDVKRIINNPDWVPLADVAKERLDDAMRHTRLVRAMGAKQAKENSSEHRRLDSIVKAVVAKLDADGARYPAALANVKRLDAMLDRMATEVNAADEWDIAILADQSGGAVTNSAARFNELRRNVFNKVTATFPLLNGAPTVRGDYKSTIRDYDYKVADDMLAHLCDYVAIFG